MAGELLLELLSEEIPARMQRRAIEDFCALVRDKLAAAEIAPQTLRGYVTPRRLAVIAGGIPERQPDRSEERRGPRVGAPQAALDGFLRAAGLRSISECETRDTGRGEFHFAVLRHKGQAAGEILPELLRAAIGELPWPKSMRYPASSLRWVRPLISVVCLFDGAILPLPLDQIPVGRTTRGHRFLSEGEITVDSAADYLNWLEVSHVILDQDRRREIIAAGLERLAAAEGLRVKPDPGLLDEVTGLVEFPVVLMGAIDEASMALPPEVLATAMRTHQKYFSCLKPEPAPAEAGGTAAPRFLFVANNLTADHGRTILLSSHILVEVEQICTHAAVMNHGRLVATGTVDDLIGGSRTVFLEVDDVGRAVQLLQSTTGVSQVEVEPPGISLTLNGIERKDIVTMLVKNGIGIETVASRHRLEDAFLGMVEELPHD